MKKLLCEHGIKPSFYQFLRKMRLTFLLVIVTVLSSLAAEGYSQTTKLTIVENNSTLLNVMKVIENKSEFNFFYNEKVNVNMPVSAEFANKTITEILDKVLANSSVRYKVLGRQIALYDRSEMEPFMAEQGKKVSGKVTDNSGSPLPGVSVVIKGSSIGVTTDMDGNFNLTSTPENATLIFSFVGMKSKEIAVGGRNEFNVVLEDETIGLQEVVAVGYGSVQKKELTSAISSIASKDLLQGAFNSPLQMLDGKVAGVTVSNPAAADPNRGTDIQVRGASSIDAGNGPLIIIDGMPGGDLRNVAQQDIESMTVLKDGSAAAIYGSRAANGVILVQTKKGKSGKVVVTYDSYVEHDVVAEKPDILSAEEFLSHNIDVDRGARTNWYDELVRKNNFGQNHFLSASGGSENTIFRISANYRDKSAIDIASERKETGIRASFQQKAMDGFLELSGNLSYKEAIEEYTNYGVFQQAVKLNPTIPVMDPENPTKYYRMYGYDTFNPVQNLNERENGADQTYSIIDFNIKMNLLKNLNTELKLARQSRDMFKREYYTSKSKESIDNMRTGRARLQDEKWSDYTLEWIGNYFTTIDKHYIKAMGGYSYQEFNNYGFWAENMDFLSDAFGYNNLDAGKWNLEKGRLGMDSWRSKEKTIAFFGRANYSYDDTFLFSGSVRYEGNTKFGSENKWGMFPAASAAWRISKLPAFSQISSIDDLKLRISYGETGRSGFGRYSALARYQGFGRWQNDAGQWIQVYGPSNNPNPDLRWEKQISYNLGVDFSLFNSRLNGSFDAFIRKGKDVISNYDAPVPPFLHDQIFTNVGTTVARGVELIVNWQAVQKKDFTYSTNLTTSYIN